MKSSELVPLKHPLVYDSPTQGFDWTVSNKGEGMVVLSFTPGEMQIGELKQALRSIIKNLDKCAKQWGVPSNLDGFGRARVR